ncbi:dUTP diphosphatase [Alteribacillus iranensis]|uniref:Dimeric dUTPase, all-alpha-NTP-PPase (MazG) superfamily n=1 Tax=Alteribacillus iranensis TaxID=930128 RepID=A0A1I2CKL6_9BACI|nr:Dimeric dUTPase, all-alpha-NTP-PPase (MazG) superfamily [Alteribacillus iranensis]
MKQLYSIQKQLDDRILQKHQLRRDDLFFEKVLALLTEVGELANETRCFKFWSNKPASEKPVILEEYVDGIHFILSLGIDGGWEETPDEPVESNISWTEQFIRVHQEIMNFQQEPGKERFLTVFREYLQLGKQLGFTMEEIETAYYSKNKMNHKRQIEGY